MPPESRRRVNIVQWLQRWGKNPDAIQWRFLHVTGRTKAGVDLRLSVRVRGLSLNDSDGFALTVRDVGANVTAANELKHQHLITTRVLALSEDAVVLLDGPKRITYCNPSVTRLFGYRHDQLVGQLVDILLPQRFREVHRIHLSAFECGESPSRMMGERGEIIGLHADGSEIPMEASITKVRVGDTQVFAAHLRDIRARKHAQAAIEASENRFRHLFEHVLEAMAMLSMDGTVKSLNASARDLLGEEVLAGSTFWDLNWWPQLSEAALEVSRARLNKLVTHAAEGKVVREQVDLRDALRRLQMIYLASGWRNPSTSN